MADGRQVPAKVTASHCVVRTEQRLRPQGSVSPAWISLGLSSRRAGATCTAPPLAVEVAQNRATLSEQMRSCCSGCLGDPEKHVGTHKDIRRSRDGIRPTGARQESWGYLGETEIILTRVPQKLHSSCAKAPACTASTDVLESQVQARFHALPGSCHRPLVTRYKGS